MCRTWAVAAGTAVIRVSVVVVADGTLDHADDGRAEHAVVDVGYVEFAHPEPEPGHAVAEHPQVGVGVHLDVGGEVERDRVAGHHRRGVGRVPPVPPVRVPAADGVLVDQRVEQRAGRGVHGHGRGLHAGRPVAQVLVLIVRVGRAPVGLQHARVHAEHARAGQRVEVQRAVAVGAAPGQRHPEHAVLPLGPHAAHVEHGGHRVEVEVWVFHAPRRVVAPAVHHHAPADVGQVRVRAAALSRVHVHHQPREPRAAVPPPQARVDRVLPHLPVRFQVEHHQLRFAVLRAVGRGHVHQPQPVARVHRHPERVDDAARGLLVVRRQPVHRVTRVWHQRRRTVPVAICKTRHCINNKILWVRGRNRA